MTWEIDIHPVDERDVAELLANIREADLEESRAMTVLAPDVALRMSINMSDEAYAGRVDGRLVAVFGVARKTTLSTEGVPWMVGTPLIERYGITVARRSRNMVRLWRTKYTYMRNYVDIRNTVSIHWLKWLGFTLHTPVPYGVKQLPFHPFDMRN